MRSTGFLLACLAICLCLTAASPAPAPDTIKALKLDSVVADSFDASAAASTDVNKPSNPQKDEQRKKDLELFKSDLTELTKSFDLAVDDAKRQKKPFDKKAWRKNTEADLQKKGRNPKQIGRLMHAIGSYGTAKLYVCKRGTTVDTDGHKFDACDASALALKSCADATTQKIDLAFNILKNASKGSGFNCKRANSRNVCPKLTMTSKLVSGDQLTFLAYRNIGCGATSQVRKEIRKIKKEEKKQAKAAAKGGAIGGLAMGGAASKAGATSGAAPAGGLIQAFQTTNTYANCQATKSGLNIYPYWFDKTPVCDIIAKALDKCNQSKQDGRWGFDTLWDTQRKNFIDCDCGGTQKYYKGNSHENFCTKLRDTMAKYSDTTGKIYHPVEYCVAMGSSFIVSLVLACLAVSPAASLPKIRSQALRHKKIHVSNADTQTTNTDSVTTSDTRWTSNSNHAGTDSSTHSDTTVSNSNQKVTTGWDSNTSMDTNTHSNQNTNSNTDFGTKWNPNINTHSTQNTQSNQNTNTNTSDSSMHTTNYNADARTINRHGGQGARGHSSSDSITNIGTTSDTRTINRHGHNNTSDTYFGEMIRSMDAAIDEAKKGNRVFDLAAWRVKTVKEFKAKGKNRNDVRRLLRAMDRAIGERLSKK
ncbi:hypothetical protein HDU97_001509 [Phlyctochytrium planicorne]|nr:hypothetical protein HDU97_001509 [Phlyctochytrium planicorne]